MKRMKKILAVLLAAIMVMSLGTSVLAGESTATTYTITISNSVSGYSYAAYQIFDGDLSNSTLSNITWGTGVDSDKTSALLVALKKISSSGTIGTSEDSNGPFYSCTDARSVAEALAKYTEEDNAVAQAFAEVVVDYLSSTASGSTDTLTESNNYQITNQDAGYYLVKTTSVPSGGSDTAYTRYILKVVDNVTITEKKSVPIVTKQVTDTDGTTLVDATSASAGETVSFTLTATMPSTYSDYDNYALTFHDTLSTNLTYVENSLTVTVNTYVPQNNLESFSDDTTYYILNEGTYTEVTDKSSDPDSDTTYYVYTTTTVGSTNCGYTLVAGSISNNDGCSLEVKITNTDELKESSDSTDAIIVNESSTIVVTYSATVASGISTAKAETNSVKLEYSNNPNDDSDTGTTTEDIVYVYTYDLNVYKTDGEDNALSGASFTLYKQVTIKEFENNVTYYTYTENATAMTAVESGTVYSSETTYYVKVNDTATATTENDSKQVATFSDLGEGRYVLEESTTPAGYNTAALVKFEIKATYSDDGTSVSKLETDNSNVKAVNDDSTTTLTTTIENEAGSKLPTTGGIGTTIFYVVGAILVVSAAVILITRRRMANRT